MAPARVPARVHPRGLNLTNGNGPQCVPTQWSVRAHAKTNACPRNDQCVPPQWLMRGHAIIMRAHVPTDACPRSDYYVHVGVGY